MGRERSSVAYISNKRVVGEACGRSQRRRTATCHRNRRTGGVVRSKSLRPVQKPLPLNQGRFALREAFAEAVARLKLSPARGSEGRAAGGRNELHRCAPPRPSGAFRPRHGLQGRGGVFFFTGELCLKCVSKFLRMTWLCSMVIAARPARTGRTSSRGCWRIGRSASFMRPLSSCALPGAIRPGRSVTGV